ncbi:radical SAM family heme chaperone HemW [Hyphomicrobium sp. NDB2Meth4]|uniref:radical SAM family heme chaperone HemW n=1 Tax=Hyphomicrobium sp. NDB2Meth4 TaxID=1892846 RepID=UPI000B063524|nr:radical SAM family heme chaperone HemW [Hyphomicrobium sp. NDB2Meth4]
MTPPDDPGFGLYVHWPFCAQKCPYCDFNSHVRFGGIDEPRFRAAFLRELEHTATRLGPRTVSSIFFGGGTPSLMQPETVAAILDRAAELWHVAPDAEITLEANPGSVEAGRFRGYRSAGVNRVSLGVQSLRDDILKSLGRIHSVAEAKAAIEIARTTFDRFSFDLIYARPKQTTDEWRAELREALLIAGQHLSLYQLTIEPETPFAALHAAGKLIVPDEDTAFALYDLTQEMTAAAGLPAYEVSNHAGPGEESRHNLLYWRYGEYAGIGPGAHGRIVLDGVRNATSTERNPEAWAALVERDGHGIIEEMPLTRPEQADEMLLMGLRLSEGLDLQRLAQLCGAPLPGKTVSELTQQGLIEAIPGTQRIKASGSGRFILNEIVLRLALDLPTEKLPSAAE